MKLKLTSKEKKILNRTLKSIRLESDLKFNVQKEIWIQKSRRRDVAKKFKQRLLDSVLKSSNIDPTVITRRQELEFRSAESHRVTMINKIFPISNLITQKHTDNITILKTLAKTKSTPRPTPLPLPPPAPGPKPVAEVIILNKAEKVHLDGTGITNLSPWNNTLKTVIGAHDYSNPILQPPGPDVPEFQLRCDFEFIYRPTRSGVLHAWAFVASNGLAEWATHGACEDLSLLVACAKASVVVLQPSTTVLNKIELPEQLLGPEVHAGNFGIACSSEYGIHLQDRFLVFETNAMQLPVIANAPVQLFVSINLQGFAAEGMCAFDFKNGSRQINVPAVILNLL